jgi:hypothetical protein
VSWQDLTQVVRREVKLKENGKYPTLGLPIPIHCLEDKT